MRVVLRRVGFATVLDDAITQLQRYGSSDPQVMARLYRPSEKLGWHVDDVEVVHSQLVRLRATTAAADFSDAEMARSEGDARRVDDVPTRPR